MVDASGGSSASAGRFLSGSTNMAISSLSNVGSISVSPNQTDSTMPRIATQTSVNATPRQSPNKQAIERAIAAIKETIAPSSSSLRFSIDSDTKQSVVRVVDSQTGDVIRQIPVQELIDIAKALDHAKGLLLRQRA